VRSELEMLILFLITEQARASRHDVRLVIALLLRQARAVFEIMKGGRP